ncbi:MAG TPA: hypothetical protein VFG52_08090 [Xanthomonadales bacterium]|nr:hypothetical protein [Xanthomonadales bacterium]
MSAQLTLRKALQNLVLGAVLLCLPGVNVLAVDKQSTALQLLDHDTYRTVHVSEQLPGKLQARVHPGTPLILAPVAGAFEFDLAGSEIPKLQLQLAHPLQLQTDLSGRNPSSGSMLGLDATLTLPMGNGFALRSRNEQASLISQNQAQYQSLGSIQCLNGTLKPDSYTASGCRFVNEQPAAFDRSTLSLGASKDFGAFSSSINWFTSQTSSGQRGLNPANRFNQAPVIDPMRYSSPAMNGFLPGLSSASLIDSEASGVDLNFQVGFTTDHAGTVQLGLALTRVYDAKLNGLDGEVFTPLSWNEAEPFSAAALGIEWQRGSFSSGIRGYYREQVNFLDRQSLDSMGTFDVHFTWRAPWNANFSVGASNVLGAGADDRNTADKPVSTDRFESIYGRIPYVRYQQDL